MNQRVPAGSKSKDARASEAATLDYVQGLVRFLLELGLLVGLGYWGWHLGSDAWQQVVLAVALPLVAALVWTTFRTPGDESAGRPGRVRVRGPVRLGLEFALFLLAAFGLWSSGSRVAAETLLTFTALHYILTWNRVAWMLRH